METTEQKVNRLRRHMLANMILVPTRRRRSCFGRFLAWLDGFKWPT